MVLRGSDGARTLTPLQREVLMLVGCGLTNREIASRLGTTPGWVGTQVGRIVLRLGLSCRADIAALVSRRGWSDPDTGRDAGTFRSV